MATTVVNYELDEDTTVWFEIEPSAEFRPADPKIKPGTGERYCGGTGRWSAVRCEPGQATGVRVTA